MRATPPSPAAPVEGLTRVGCSGWHYRHWRSAFYPADLPVHRRFERYRACFDTVELNSTFYRLPSPEAVQRWHDAAPPGFTYATKLGAFGSHRMKLRDAAKWLPNHLDRVALLGDAAGPTVAQLPPRWRRDVPRLAEFLSAVRALSPRHLRWAVELRHPSWIDDDVFSLLEEHDVALCLHDLLPEQPWLVTTGWTYVRMHGPAAPARPYVGRYPRVHLAGLATRLTEVLLRGGDVYVYFNNDHEAAAVADALLLRGLLGTELAARSPAAVR